MNLNLKNNYNKDYKNIACVTYGDSNNKALVVLCSTMQVLCSSCKLMEQISLTIVKHKSIKATFYFIYQYYLLYIIHNYTPTIFYILNIYVYDLQCTLYSVHYTLYILQNI